jgi:DNA gyrase/topoisomerase IV subunit B
LDLKSLDVQWASNRASLRLATIFVLVIELILNAIDGIMASYHENIPIFQRGLSIL